MSDADTMLTLYAERDALAAECERLKKEAAEHEVEMMRARDDAVDVSAELGRTQIKLAALDAKAAALRVELVPSRLARDDDGSCAECGSDCATRSGEDPTPECDHCAHALLERLRTIAIDSTAGADLLERLAKAEARVVRLKRELNFDHSSLCAILHDGDKCDCPWESCVHRTEQVEAERDAALARVEELTKALDATEKDLCEERQLFEHCSFWSAKYYEDGDALRARVEALEGFVRAFDKWRADVVTADECLPTGIFDLDAARSALDAKGKGTT
jgi:hypothetical protein